MKNETIKAAVANYMDVKIAEVSVHKVLARGGYSFAIRATLAAGADGDEGGETVDFVANVPSSSGAAEQEQAVAECFEQGEVDEVTFAEWPPRISTRAAANCVWALHNITTLSAKEVF